jgi:hypothetical protein
MKKEKLGDTFWEKCSRRVMNESRGGGGKSATV